MPTVDSVIDKAQALIDKEEAELKARRATFEDTVDRWLKAIRAGPGHGSESDDLDKQVQKLAREISEIASKIAGKQEATKELSDCRWSMADAKAAYEKLVKDEGSTLGRMVAEYNLLLVRLAWGDADGWKEEGPRLIEKIVNAHHEIAGKLEVGAFLPKS